MKLYGFSNKIANIYKSNRICTIFHTTFDQGVFVRPNLYDISYNVQGRRLLKTEFVRYFIQHSIKTPSRDRVCLIFHTTSPTAVSYNISYSVIGRHLSEAESVPNPNIPTIAGRVPFREMAIEVYAGGDDRVQGLDGTGGFFGRCRNREKNRPTIVMPVATTKASLIPLIVEALVASPPRMVRA